MGLRRELAKVVAMALLVASLGGLAVAQGLERSGASSQTVPGREPVVGSAATIVVTSTGDSGPGTLRQALEDAQQGDIITFDPTVFPPTSPATISLASELPPLDRDSLTIDGSDAGVIVDGSKVAGDWPAGLGIVDSSANVIRGLQISGFSGPGIAISGHAQRNVIGGDRGVGSGPHGQGNLLAFNATGVVLSTRDTTMNTVTGNLIGTDATSEEAWGNRNQGVWVTEGTHGNTIGPDNVIAHNGGAGVEVHEQDTVRNTITQNSIHDNGWWGIVLWGGNALLAAPTIFQFDLLAGTATGTTCRNCTVEVFSDSSDEGAHFEGQVTADDAGVFVLNKGAPFAGPNLTSTATNLDGDTSEFSLPATGTRRSLTLQQGNALPAIHLPHKHSGELLDNRIGASIIGRRDPGDFDSVIYGSGVTRARVAINHQEPEYVFWDRPEFQIPPQWDAVITRMADNDLKLKYKLTFWDKATYPEGMGAPCARFKTEGEIQRYLEFVRFIVGHFKDRIQYYELWNEPDIENYCPKWIEVADYINLVKRVVPVIRDEYPDAKIVVGGVSGLRYLAAQEYLYALLRSDIMPLVDVVSWHPMYGTSPEYEVFRDYYYQYPSIVQRIKDMATAHGFDGEYHADELTWRASETADGDPYVYSLTVAAKYATRGIVMHLGMDVALSVTIGAGYAKYKLCTVMAGALPAPLPVRTESTATNIMSYTFTLPDEKRLVALWTDGTAAEYDPGITATVTISGFTDHTVAGIDVLYAFEQPLIANEENGDLVIRNVLVRDYPVLLRLSPTRRVFLPAMSRVAARN